MPGDSSIAVARPLVPGQSFNAAYSVILQAPTGSRYVVDRMFLATVSSLARALLEADEKEEVIPLDSPHCTESAVAHFVTWLNEYSSGRSAMTRVTYPLPAGSLEEIFTPWDLQFIHQCLVPNGDMHHHKELYLLAGLAAYLGVTVLQEMCCAYFSWHIRRVTAAAATVPDAPTATAAVRDWFGLTGDFTESEVKTVVDKFRWCREVDYVQLEKDSREAHDRVVASRGSPR